MMSSVTCDGLNVGRAASRRAATPLMMAAAIEVPVRLSNRAPPVAPLLPLEEMSCPGAAMAT